MNIYMRLAIKVLLLTAGFALLLLAAIFTTTLIFQSHVHPDEWRTTGYDVAAMTLVAAAYIAMLARVIRNFAKSSRGHMVSIKQHCPLSPTGGSVAQPTVQPDGAASGGSAG